MAALSTEKLKAEGGKAQSAPAGVSGLEKDKAWRVALQVVHDIEGPNSKANNDITQSKGRKRDYRAVGADGVKTSTIDDNMLGSRIQTNDGDAYYMLGDFNHVEQHTHLADGFLVGIVSVLHCCTCTAPPACRARGRQLLPVHLHSSGWSYGGPLLPVYPRPLQGRLIKASASNNICSREQWHEEQLAFTEVEFEWYARQWFRAP